MTAPVLSVTVDDLATYLQIDPSAINSTAAALYLQLAQDKCSQFLTPLPPAALGLVLEVAARAYNNVDSAQSVGIGTAHIAYAGQTGSVIGGLYLSRQNKAELRRLAGAGGAFTYDPTPVDAGTLVSPWDQNVTWLDGVPLVDYPEP